MLISSIILSLFFIISLSYGAKAELVQNFEPLPDLQEISSKNGVLSATLEAKPQKVEFAGVAIDGFVYNGEYSGSLLRVHAGDVMKIKLVNHLNEPTNLHFHGIKTTPQGHGDNVHVRVNPNESFDYEIPISKEQPSGLYWYHAHLHGIANKQVMGGLTGALLVEGFPEQFAQLKGIKERVLALKDYSFEESKDPIVNNEYHKIIQSINGKTSSIISMKSGETQLWYISNQSADYYFHLSLKGHKFRVIGGEGGSANQESLTDNIDIRPAERVAVLVDAGDAGSYELTSNKTPTGSGSNYSLNRVLAKVVVEAGDNNKPVASIASFPQKQDLANVAINANRLVVFSQDANTESYFVNGNKYSEERMDIRVPLGNVEEWTLRNESDDMHIFHIHQVNFQVMSINNKPLPFNGYVDDVRVPERSEVKIRIAFTDPQIVGRFVYHCHILDHEDKGMMANIEIYDPKQSKIKRLFSEMGYCCQGRFSTSCMAANIRLLANDF